MKRQLIKSKFLWLAYLICIVAYTGLTLKVTPAKPVLEHYHISILAARLISLTVALPFMMIWLVAFVGYTRLNRYVKLIKQEPDGQALHHISQGLFGLTAWLPVTVILGNLLLLVYRAHPSLTNALTNLDNYVNLVIVFASFTAIYVGSRQLLKLVKHQGYGVRQKKYLALAAAVIIGYIIIVFQGTNGSDSTFGSSIMDATEHNLIYIITVLVPRVVMWTLAVLAVRNIAVYGQRVKGSLYRQSLKSLAFGLSFVIISFIALRYAQTLTALLNLSLGGVLVAVYLILAFMGYGYFNIAAGASKLQKIEKL